VRRPPAAPLAAFALAAATALACEVLPPPPPPHIDPAPPTPEGTAAPAPAAPTAEEAQAFVKGVDADLRRLWVASSRASWVAQNFITDDSEALSSAAEEASMEYLSRTIKAATRFDHVEVPADVRRQLLLLKLASGLPAPSNAAERSELAEVSVAMTGIYGKGQYCPSHPLGAPEPAKGRAGKGARPEEAPRCLNLGKLENILEKSRKYEDLLDAWQGWHAIARPIKPKFERYVELGNKGAREIGFRDMGDLWRSGYDMSAAEFEADTDRLYAQVKPLYEKLHCYVRGRLRKRYPEAKIGPRAPIPAHLLGNMWAQEWQNVYDLVEPYQSEAPLDVTKHIKGRKLDEKAMVRLGESFFVSLGLDPLPETFWDRSLFKTPLDHAAVCHASAWDVTFDNDLRIKMCIEPKEDDLTTIHHELGHDYYFHAYYKLPMLFQQGANDGFHEGIGDTIALSVTPAYLKSIGLLDRVPDSAHGEINVLLKMALDKVAFLPFGKLIDQWRWDVFSGKTKPSEYNKAWWDLRRALQGVAPPTARSEADFDPGAKYHVPANTPYVRYFLARIYQFQFHRALCKAAGYTGPLHKCSIHGSKAAGQKLQAMLALGASRPWPEAMALVSGEREADARALLEYFEPLSRWLDEQNKGEACGW
jgi:peptidyl-dipeptidase A